MKFGTRLILFYLAAVIIPTIIAGFAVIKSIEYVVMDSVEKQLGEQNKMAQAFIAQVLSQVKPEEDVLAAVNAKLMKENFSSNFGELYIYNNEFKPIRPVYGDNKEIPAFNESEEHIKKVLEPAINGNYVYLVKNNTAYFASPIEHGLKYKGVLEIGYKLDFLNNILAAVIQVLIIGIVILFLIIFTLGLFISKRMSLPINQIAETANRYARRDFTPLEINRKDEFGRLGESINAMGAQLKDYIQRQKLFVSNVSHELRTPLTAIKGYSEYMVDEVAGNPTLEKAVYHLNNESERLAKMVNELLLLSRLDSLQEPFAFSRLNLSELVERTVSQMKLKADKFNVKLFSQIEKNLYVNGDGEKLIQVFLNLIDNAIKFSKPESWVAVNLNNEYDMALVTVVDKGIGIPQEELNKIFDRFYRASNTRGITGTGLGLAISKEIIVGHNGSIELTNSNESGTTASVRIPVS